MIIQQRKADRAFSNLVLGYPYALLCEKCNAETATDTSHFYVRKNASVRYVMDNADAFCRKCHDYFHDHPEEYRVWKLKRLGTKKYMRLQRLAAMVMPMEQAITNFMKTQNNEHQNKEE